MGYHSTFEGTICCECETEREAVLATKLIAQNNDNWFVSGAKAKGTTIDIAIYAYAKWYQSESDIRDFVSNLKALGLGNICGQIEVAGENHHDLWRILIEDGRCKRQKGHVVYG